jgi:hypothetical protein
MGRIVSDVLSLFNPAVAASKAAQVATSLVGGAPEATPEAAPDAPTEKDAAVQDARVRERRRTRGRATTLLTGGSGLMDSANVSRKTLLGT